MCFLRNGGWISADLCVESLGFLLLHCEPFTNTVVTILKHIHSIQIAIRREQFIRTNIIPRMKQHTKYPIVEHFFLNFRRESSSFRRVHGGGVLDVRSNYIKEFFSNRNDKKLLLNLRSLLHFTIVNIFYWHDNLLFYVPAGGRNTPTLVEYFYR